MPHHSKQHTLWLLAALAAPVSHFSGCGWLTGIATALAILPLTLLPGNWDALPKPLAILEILWLGVAAGTLLPGSAAYWPSDNDLAVPLTLLALAFCTGVAAAPRIGAVLSFCMALLALPMVLSGAAHIQTEWLAPTISWWPMGLTLALLLPNLPAAGKVRKGKGVISAIVLVAAVTALVQGVLSTGVASEVPDPFYQTARTLGHLEPIAAAAVTLGWYSMTAWLLESAAIMAKTSGIGEKTAYVLPTGTAAVMILLKWQPEASYIAVLSAFFWGLIPFFQNWYKTKNSA